MTNFSGATRTSARWFTPENWVLLLPIAGGALVLVLQLFILLPPLLLQAQQRRQAIGVLERQQAQLPRLRDQLRTSQIELQRKRDQQQRLLTLVAGTEDLRTWLTGLNDIAAATGVVVAQVEPGPLQAYVPPPPPAEPAAGQATPATPATPKLPVDPLLVPNLQKRTATITLRGTFHNLQRFLQQLETLQVIAITSDLQLGRPGQVGIPGLVAQQPSSAQANDQTQRLELRLKLSAYGRVPGPS